MGSWRRNERLPLVRICLLYARGGHNMAGNWGLGEGRGSVF